MVGYTLMLVTIRCMPLPGDGDANILSYTYYNGEIWILYSNSVNEGAESYHMEKYEELTS